MTPHRNPNGTLTDLLDRVLDKGLVIDADVIVSVAGIPLIGVKLRAALAGMETMLRYGIMQAWDEKTREWERKTRREKEVCLLEGEKVRLRMLGAVYLREGIYAAWRYAVVYLTDERLLLYHEGLNQRLFEVPLKEIRGLFVRERDGKGNEGVSEELCLLLDAEEPRRLIAWDIHQLKEAIQKAMESAGLSRQESLALPQLRDVA